MEMERKKISLKNSRRIACLAVLISVFADVSCTKDTLVEQQASVDTVLARFESDHSRTMMDQTLNPVLRWNAGDRISLFGSAVNECYRFTGKDGDAEGSYEHESGSTGMMTAIPVLYAYYPYAESNSITDSGISVNLPWGQSYRAESFGPGAAPMISMAQKVDVPVFEFKPLCGYLNIKLWNASGARVKSVAITAGNGVGIAGPASAYYNGTDAPVLTMGPGAGDEVVLDCGSGVALGKTAATATSFWIVLPPVTLGGGFTIKVTSVDGKVFEKTTTKSRTIQRNVTNSMAPLECTFASSQGEETYGSFWKYVIRNYDTDKDGVMSDSEIAAVKQIDVSGQSFDSLAGLERLVELETLNIANQPVATVDITANRKLIWVYAVGCTNLSQIVVNTLTAGPSIMVSRETNLKHGEDLSAIPARGKALFIPGTSKAYRFAIDFKTSYMGGKDATSMSLAQAKYLVSKYDTFEAMLDLANLSGYKTRVLVTSETYTDYSNGGVIKIWTYTLQGTYKLEALSYIGSYLKLMSVD